MPSRFQFIRFAPDEALTLRSPDPFRSLQLAGTVYDVQRDCLTVSLATPLASSELTLGALVHLHGRSGRFGLAEVVAICQDPPPLVLLRPGDRGFYGADHRRFPRTPTPNLTALVICIVDGRAAGFRVAVTDLNQRGAGIVARRPLIVGETVYFQLPGQRGERAVSLEARVAWARSVSIWWQGGLEFLTSSSSIPVADEMHAKRTDLQTPTPRSSTAQYAAGGSQGWDGWAMAAGWFVTNGTLINQPSLRKATDRIFPTYKIKHGEYALEAEIQALPGDTPNFGLILRSGTIIGAITIQQYLAGRQANGETEAAWHTYRVDVSWNKVKLFIDGGLLVERVDHAYRMVEQFGLFAATPLRMRAFRVLSFV